MLRNALNNLAGALVPALVMLVTVPVFIKGLGAPAYGLFVIVTSVTGYLAVLDINVSSGAIKFVAEARALRDDRRIGEVLGFSLGFYLLIGIVGAALIYVFAQPLVGLLGGRDLVAVQPAVEALRVAAFAFLLGQLYTMALGVPQALERYDLSSRIEIGNGVAVPLVSAAVVMLGGHLVEVMWLRNGVALLSLLLLAWMIHLLLPHARPAWPGAVVRAQLLSFSAFAYLNRLASLSYQHADKLVIAAVLDIRDVAFYSVPVMLANRILGMSYRLTQVIFPASSALLARGEIEQVRRLMLTNMRYVFALNAMAVVALGLAGHWFLSHWLGEEFARRGTAVLILIACGALLDSITNAPSMVTDGAGKPQVTGIFAIIRAAAGLAGLFLGARWGGIVGVAGSHLVISLLGTSTFLAYFGRYVLPMQARTWLLETMLPGGLLAAAGATTGLTVLQLPLPADIGVPVAVCGALGVMLSVFWRHVLSKEHRRLLAGRYLRGFGGAT